MSTRPSMQTFIDDNREHLKAIIVTANQAPFLSLDDDDIEQWIVNYEPLYLMAQQAGVDV